MTHTTNGPQTEPLKDILLVEDSPAQAQVFQSYLTYPKMQVDGIEIQRKVF